MPENRKPQTRLDPRQPFVLDTRELGRRPGSMRTQQLRVPAPGNLAVELVGVPAGSEVDLDLRLESVMEGVLVSGTASVRLEGECGRCLDPVTDSMIVPLQELFAYPFSSTEQTTDDEEAARMVGDLLDLQPVVRDAVVLALPLTPLCDPDCPGLCPECGERLAELPAGHRHTPPEPPTPKE